jgi:hypothetical protein
MALRIFVPNKWGFSDGALGRRFSLVVLFGLVVVADIGGHPVVDGAGVGEELGTGATLTSTGLRFLVLS